MSQIWEINLSLLANDLIKDWRKKKKRSSKGLEITTSRIPRKGGIQNNSNQVIKSPIFVQLKGRKAGG